MSGVGQIDPNIAINANRPQSNPLEMAGQAVGLQNALLQSSLQRQALQSGQLGITKQQLDLANQHYGNLGAFLSSTLAFPPPGTKDPQTGQISTGLTKAYIQQAADRGVKMGLMTPEQAAQEIAVMPDDDAGIRQQLRELLFSTQDNATRLQGLVPTPQMVNLGPNLKPMTFAPGQPPQQMGADVPLGVPPQRLGTVNNDPNSPDYGASQNVIAPGGIPGAGVAQPGPGANAPVVNAPPQTPAPVVTSLPPGTAEYRQAGAGRAANLASAVQNIGQQRGLLNTLQTELKALPPQAIGPGSHLVQRSGQWLSEFTGGTFSPLTADQTGALDTFAKTSQQLANELLPTLGNSSDRTQIAAIASNPNQYLSKNGIERITSLLHGSLDALSAKNQAFLDSGEAPGNFNAWEAKWNKDFDPRAFQLPYMSDAQKRELISGMGGTKSAEFQRFRTYYNRAAHSGWLPTVTPQGQ